MQGFEDSDMKIVGQEAAPVAGDDAGETAELLETERKNGNLEKARKLGHLLAEDVIAMEEAPQAANGAAENEDLQLQRRILLAFAAEIALEKYLPNTLVAQTAQNQFYNLLEETTPTFVDDLKGTGAFSFYYLSARDAQEPDEKVGGTFAHLCGMKDSTSYARMGTQLYRQFVQRVQTLTQTLQFRE